MTRRKDAIFGYAKLVCQFLRRKCTSTDKQNIFFAKFRLVVSFTNSFRMWNSRFPSSLCNCVQNIIAGSPHSKVSWIATCPNIAFVHNHGIPRNDSSIGKHVRQTVSTYVCFFTDAKFTISVWEAARYPEPALRRGRAIYFLPKPFTNWSRFSWHGYQYNDSLVVCQ